MAKTLLNGVNEILKRSAIIAGDAGELASLTDSARQVSIDHAVQVINECIDELFSSSNIPLPNEQAESTITLTATRAYTLASDLSQMRWPLIDKTNNQYIYEYSGGYNGLLMIDPEQDDTGMPVFASIRPTDGKLHLDREPSADYIGNVYTYQYDKDTGLSAATDTMPFGDPVFRAMVPAWVQLFKRDRRGEFDQSLYLLNVGRAARLLTQKQMRTSWSPR
jgi:hypothetical protein